EVSRIVQERPALAGPAHVLAEVLPGLYAEQPTEAAPALDSERASAKLAGGVPLLRGESLALDVAAFRQRWLHVCTAVGSDAARTLTDVLRRGTLDPREWTQEVLAGRAEAIHARADALGLDASLAATVLRLTLFPVFVPISA